jgi:hypothetical protein
VDLRVRPRDLRRAIRAARAQGWAVHPSSRQLGTAQFFVSRTLVEIETTVGSPGVCAVTIDQMLARSRWHAGPLGRLHRVPELHDHALHLCVNAFKDKLVLGHRWLQQDLLRIGRVEGFSPDTMAARAADAKLRTLVSVVADWLANDADGRSWRQVAEAIGPPPRPRYAAVYRDLVQRAPQGRALAVVARAASDSRARQGVALGLGLLGTVLYAAS